MMSLLSKLSVSEHDLRPMPCVLAGRLAWGAPLAVVLAIAVTVIAATQVQAAPFGLPSTAGAAAASQPGLVGWIFAEQAAFYRALSGYIRASRDDGAAMWSLFGISLLYGVFHAVGPGHGKAVISSYLVANAETWRRGVILSFVSAALQSVVAVLVVAVAAVVLGATAKAIGTTVHVVEIASYLLVIAIGLRLLFVKGRSLLIACRAYGLLPQASMVPVASGDVLALFQGYHDAASCGQCRADDHVSGFRCEADHEHDAHASAWGHAHGPEPAQLAGAGGWRRGLSTVVAVGLRPCSGAIIVLIFALAQDLFWTGIGATLLMGLGTAITVAAIATVAVTARSAASRIAGAQAGLGLLMMRTVEAAASALIVAFGILLLAGYMASEQLWMFTG
jgi:nickel/cobalt exporter